MKKKAIVKLTTKEQNLQEKVDLEIKNNKINYIEENKTTVFLDLEQQILIRENKEIYMELYLKEGKGNIYIKSLRKTIELVLNLKKINISQHKIVIQYEIEKELYLYELEMED